MASTSYLLSWQQGYLAVLLVSMMECLQWMILSLVASQLEFELP